jgi:hypothetical protein
MPSPVSIISQQYLPLLPNRKFPVGQGHTLHAPQDKE